MNLIKEAVGVLTPRVCDICGKFADTENNLSGLKRLYREIFGEGEEFHICSGCMSEFVPQPPDKRWFTVLSNPLEEDPYADLTLFMPYAYSGVVDRALPRIKFGRQKNIARLIGILLGIMIRQEQIRCDLIVPVPLNKERLLERGFNQAEEIAYPAASVAGIPMANDVLIRRINTNRQAKITDAALRAVNVAGAFETDPSWVPEGLTIMLLDDVATTGHTLREGAVTLLKSGASDVLCCAFSGNRQIKNDEPF